MIHVRKQLYLAQSPLRIDPVIERIRDSLNRHLLLRLCIGSRAAAQQNSTESHKPQSQLQGEKQGTIQLSAYQTRP